MACRSSARRPSRRARAGVSGSAASGRCSAARPGRPRSRPGRSQPSACQLAGCAPNTRGGRPTGSRPKRGSDGCSWSTKNQSRGRRGRRPGSMSKPNRAMSGSIRPKKIGLATRSRPGWRRPPPPPTTASDRVDDHVGVAADQLAPHQQHERVGGQLAVLPERRGPLVDRADVAAAGSAGAADVPEAAEVGAALVGRVAVPQQLAGHLVVEADQERLDEAPVGREQRDGVGRGHLVQPGQQPLARRGRPAARTSAGGRPGAAITGSMRVGAPRAGVDAGRAAPRGASRSSRPGAAWS